MQSYCLRLRCGHWLADTGYGGVRGESSSIIHQAKAKFMVRAPSPSSQGLLWENTSAQELFLGMAHTGSSRYRSCESTSVEGSGARLHVDFLQMGENTEGATHL